MWGGVWGHSLVYEPQQLLLVPCRTDFIVPVTRSRLLSVILVFLGRLVNFQIFQL